MSTITKKVKEKGDFEIQLGSSPELDYSFKDIEEIHAELKREGDRLFLRDLKSSQGTFVNNKKIGTKWHEITLNDRVLLGEVELEIKPELLLGRDRVGLDARDLYYTIPDRSKHWINPPRRILTNNVSLCAEPETLIGIMGPSGAGKTVLLNLLSGYLKPEKGIVMVGNFDVHESFGLIKDIIGYVPQDDTLIPELTVFQSLHYCLRLGYPDMQTPVRQTLIEDVLKGMGFTGERLKKLLNTKIGSPNQRGLSGGERKRVNIAHELVRNPLILFLDEPTSGLSSVDSKYVISLLKEICKEKKVTMLTTIHQPSGAIFNLFDKLLLVNIKEDGKKDIIGGNVVYFGAVSEVVNYFQQYSDERTEENPAEYVLKVLENKGSWKSEYSKYSAEELYRAGQEKEKQKIPDENKQEKQQKGYKRKYNLFYQFLILMERNFQIRISDKASLGLLLFQALIISFLLIITFKGFQSDYKDFDKFARTWFQFISSYDESVKKSETVIAERLFRQSRKLGDSNSSNIGEQSAQRRASILFLIIASAIWFGVVNASREIVAEKSILKRETRGALCISSYLMAKICILAIIAMIQTGILLMFTSHFLLSVSLSKFFWFWFILILTSVAGSCLSLFISSVAKTEQFALMAVPILIIPQLFLGGLVRPFKFFSDTFYISDFILQKWAFKAMLVFDSMNQKNVLMQLTDLDNKDPVKYISFTKETISDVFFGNQVPSLFFSFFSANTNTLLMISLHAVIPLLFTYIWLKKIYS